MEEVRSWYQIAWQYLSITLIIGYYVLVLLAVFKLLLENKKPAENPFLFARHDPNSDHRLARIHSIRTGLSQE